MIKNYYLGSKIQFTLLIEYQMIRNICLRFESLHKQNRSCLAWMILNMQSKLQKMLKKLSHWLKKKVKTLCPNDKKSLQGKVKFELLC